MISNSDIKIYLRDLVYIEEDVIVLAKKAHLPKNAKKKIMRNLALKQEMLIKIISFFNEQKD